MRIGYDGKFLWQGRTLGSRSGHGIQTRELLDGLLAQGDEHEFRVYLLHAESGLTHRGNLSSVVLPRIARSSAVRNLVTYALELRRSPVDVLLSYSVVPKFLPCPSVLILDDISFIAHPEWIPKRYSIPRLFATRGSVKRATRIVTATNFTKRELVRRLGVAEERVDIVPFGMRESFLEPVDAGSIEAVKRKHGISRPYILSINDIHPRKNLDGLVDAFRRLKEDAGVDHQLVLVGRTLWSYPGLFEKIEASRSREDIVVAGYVDARDLRPLYRGASLFVYPSFYEGWGLQVHEAMSSGIPVAVSRDSAMSEISGGAACEFDPYDPADMSACMHRLLSDPALCESCVEAGLRHVRNFSWDAAARSTLEICRRVVAG